MAPVCVPQDVNLTKPGTPPEIAAQHIGGFFIASAIEITFGPNPALPAQGASGHYCGLTRVHAADA